MSHIGVSGDTLSKCRRSAQLSCPVINRSRTNLRRARWLISPKAFRDSVSNSVANIDGSVPAVQVTLSNCCRNVLSVHLSIPFVTPAGWPEPTEPHSARPLPNAKTAAVPRSHRPNRLRPQWHQILVSTDPNSFTPQTGALSSM